MKKSNWKVVAGIIMMLPGIVLGIYVVIKAWYVFAVIAVLVLWLAGFNMADENL